MLKTLRARLLSVPGRLTYHARRLKLSLPANWPWRKSSEASPRADRTCAGAKPSWPPSSGYGPSPSRPDYGRPGNNTKSTVNAAPGRCLHPLAGPTRRPEALLADPHRPRAGDPTTFKASKCHDRRQRPSNRWIQAQAASPVPRRSPLAHLQPAQAVGLLVGADAERPVGWTAPVVVGPPAGGEPTPAAAAVVGPKGDIQALAPHDRLVGPERTRARPAASASEQPGVEQGWPAASTVPQARQAPWWPPRPNGRPGWATSSPARAGLLSPELLDLPRVVIDRSVLIDLPLAPVREPGGPAGPPRPPTRPPHRASPVVVTPGMPFP